MTLLESVEHALDALGVPTDCRVGVACSGGGDSVALLHLLAPTKRDVTVLHVDHGLRSDSHADAAFVEALAQELGVGCEVLRVTVRPQASMEAAAREARYAALDEAASRLHLRFVLTAHTLDDQAETVLLRATRGGSIAGIAPVRGVFVRPLLDVTREDLRGWLRERDLTWREDPSNTDVTIERNWTRHVLMPQLQQRRAGVASVLGRLAARTRDDEAALDGSAADVFARALIDGSGVLVAAGDIDLVPIAVRRRVVRMAFRSLGVEATDLDVERVLAGDRVCSRGVDVSRNPRGITFLRDPVPVPSVMHIHRGVVYAPEWGVRLRLGNADDAAWSWRCAVPGDLVEIRTRRPGDRVRTVAGTKKVQDVLVDAKIPRALRELVPIVASDREAIAVVNLTTPPDTSDLVLDVEPLQPTWSKATVWTRA